MQFRILAGMVLMIMTASTIAGELQNVLLPPPQTEGGKPLMQALKAAFDA
jgi:hypothetical protein